MHQRAASCVRSVACAFFAWILVPVAHAADGDMVLPLYDLPPGPHAAGDRAADAGSSTRANAPSARGAGVDAGRPVSSFALVEMPPDPAMPGTVYKRPHHAVGYRWQAAESWLRDHGVDAQTCYLPMVRMHTKLSASGASGTLWLYGRCSFR